MTAAVAPVVKSVALPTGVRLPYVEGGDPAGVPVVLLHGYSDSWRSWEPVLPFLPPSLRVFAPTQRGHGDAERPASGYRQPDFAADVAAFVDALGLGPVVLVGTSTGGTIAQHVALAHPGHLRGLALLGTFTTYRDNPVLAAFGQVVAGLTDPIDPGFVRDFQESTLTQPVPPAILETAVRESLKVPARVWRAVFEGCLEAEWAGDLGAVETPTLILWGDRDGLGPQADQDLLAATIPRARLEVYAGAGHVLHWEEPARVAADLAAFVGGLRG